MKKLPLLSLGGSFWLYFAGRVNNESWFAQNFADLSTESPRSPDPPPLAPPRTESRANQDGWSPSWRASSLALVPPRGEEGESGLMETRG